MHANKQYLTIFSPNNVKYIQFNVMVLIHTKNISTKQEKISELMS